MAGFDQPGVDRADRDLVDAGAFDGDGTGTGSSGSPNGGGGAGVGAHRVPAAGPVRVADQAAGQRVAVGDDAVQVAHLAFEPAGGERQGGQAGHGGAVAVDVAGAARCAGRAGRR